MNGFEGYVGIPLWNDQWVNDIIFSLLLVLLVIFALVFRANYRLFMKMVRDVFYIKERLSLFENVAGNEFVFRNFMTFQALFLCSLAIYAIARVYGYIGYTGIGINLLWIGIIFMAVFLYYLFKQLFYSMAGHIFTQPEKYKFWKTGYNAITGFWGVLLYVPVFWLVFVGSWVSVSVWLFAILYLLYRLIVIYKAIRIFNVQTEGILYIFLYLCGQEILPLIFLYEGMISLYNFIEKSAIWH